MLSLPLPLFFPMSLRSHPIFSLLPLSLFLILHLFSFLALPNFFRFSLTLVGSWLVRQNVLELGTGCSLTTLGFNRFLLAKKYMSYKTHFLISDRNTHHWSEDQVNGTCIYIYIFFFNNCCMYASVFHVKVP